MTFLGFRFIITFISIHPYFSVVNQWSFLCKHAAVNFLSVDVCPRKSLQLNFGCIVSFGAGCTYSKPVQYINHLKH